MSSSSVSLPSSPHDLTGHLLSVFRACKAASRAAFVAYVTAGFPTLNSSAEMIQQLEKSGADIIEIGVPFTDPLADGQTIQIANQLALNGGCVSLGHCLEVARSARKLGVQVPFVYMGYYNPFRSYIEQFGYDKFFQDCREVGIHGFILVDLPPEESETFRTLCRKHHTSFIPLIAPTTTVERQKHLISCADSFIYAVSLTGTTGQRTEMNANLPNFIASIKQQTDLPIAVGFGISNRQHYTHVQSMADGVVIGSAIIQQILKAQDTQTQQFNLEQAKQNIASFAQTVTDGQTAVHVEPPQITDKAGDHKTETAKSPEPLIPANFGNWGGRYVPETIVAALEQLEQQYVKAKNDPAFHAEVQSYWDYIGRPSSLHLADRLTAHAGGAQIYLKREDLNHTGAHKINNAIAQAVLAKRLGKKRLIAETGAGQHGVATATICAKLGIQLRVYMGAVDVERQSLNVFKMRMMGAEVFPVDSGSKTLKDAINEAMRDWVTNIETTHYLIGSAIGPHPFPTIVRDFQSVIGLESREQMVKLTGRLPDAVVACVGGGSNAIGMFYPFKDDKDVKLIGVEAGGDGTDTDKHSATLAAGTPGVLHGTRTYLLQDKDGQITETHSISAGLDYPGVGPEHAYFKDIGRADYVAVTDKQALEGFSMLTRLEGIIPALESSHAIYHAVQLAKTMKPDQNILICLSGRGDKDIDSVRKYMADHGLEQLPF